MRTKRRKVSAWGRAEFVARWLAGVVLVLACGVAEGAEETTAAWGKAEEVVFPRVEFERATVADVMEWMAYAAEAVGMGVRVEPGTLEGAPPLTMKMGGTVREIVETVGEAWGCRVELEEDESGWVFRRDYSGWGMRVVEDGSGGTDGRGTEAARQGGEGALRAQ